MTLILWITIDMSSRPSELAYRQFERREIAQRLQYDGIEIFWTSYYVYTESMVACTQC